MSKPNEQPKFKTPNDLQSIESQLGQLCPKKVAQPALSSEPIAKRSSRNQHMRKQWWQGAAFGSISGALAGVVAMLAIVIVWQPTHEVIRVVEVEVPTPIETQIVEDQPEPTTALPSSDEHLDQLIQLVEQHYERRAALSALQGSGASTVRDVRYDPMPVPVRTPGQPTRQQLMDELFNSQGTAL